MKQLRIYLFFLSFIFLSLAVFGQTNPRPNVDPALAPFYHGVASGDPLSDRVIIWTRVTPPTGDLSEIDVLWQVATDINFNNVVSFGMKKTSTAQDFTVKIDVGGLEPDKHYYYMFRALNKNSLIGRTKTAPTNDASGLRFAVVSCSSYEHGFFNVYEAIAQQNDDLDAVLHLGDYIYEYEINGYSNRDITNGGRRYAPATELISLDEYRVRHSHYKLDEQLRKLHLHYPFVTTWDDHESADNAWKNGATNHGPGGHDGSGNANLLENGITWDMRKNNSKQAYFEWMPIRERNLNGQDVIFRSINYGNLAELIVLDGRIHGRDQQDGFPTDTNRTMLGLDQLAWFKNKLNDTSTLWKVVCQQVMLSPLRLGGAGIPLNDDQWDGYSAERNKILDHVLDPSNPVKNFVVLTGDIHTSWANNIPYRNQYNSTTKEGAAGVEFVVTSVTSPGFQEFLSTLSSAVKNLNPHVDFVDLTKKGYLILDVNENRVQADYHFINTVATKDISEVNFDQNMSWHVNNDERFLRSSSSRVPIHQPLNAPPVSMRIIPDISVAKLPSEIHREIEQNQTEKICLLEDIIKNISSLPEHFDLSTISEPSFGRIKVENTCLTYTPNRDFCGRDTAVMSWCLNPTPSTYDTFYLIYDVVRKDNVSRIYRNIAPSQSIEICAPVKKNMSTAADNNTVIATFYNGNGTILLKDDTCFVFTAADSDELRREIIGLKYCDTTLNQCDSTTVIVDVVPSTSPEVFNFRIAKDKQLNTCIDFDEISQPYTRTKITSTTNRNNIITDFSDTCLSFKPASSLSVGDVETISFSVCQNSVPSICDTAIIQITVDAATNLIKKDSNLIVFGIYPNPFTDYFLIQYMLETPQEVTIRLIDINGKQIFIDRIKQNSTGVQYAKIGTSNIPKGNYILELETDSGFYSKKIVKLIN